MKGLCNSKLKHKGWGRGDGRVVGGGGGGGGSEYHSHPIMISIITLTTLMDIKIVCDMVI